MPSISDKVSYSLDDFFILTGWTTEETNYAKIDLTTQLAPNVVLRYPFIAAAMSCVTGYDITLACAKNGIMAVVPSSLPIDEQVDIAGRVKKQEVRKGDIEFVDDPVWITNDRTVKSAIELYNEYGHSIIPICDDYRRLKGVFRYKEGIRGRTLEWKLDDALEKARNGKRLGEIFIPFDKELSDYGTSRMDTAEIRDKMAERELKYLPVIDENGHLTRLAFIYQYYGYLVGGAIHTHEGWEKRADKLLEAGTDMIFIDSSDGKSDYQIKVLTEFKKRNGDVPICAGNIIDADGYRRLVGAGADAIKAGMGSGGSCITTEGRGVGRGMATALMEIHEEKMRQDETIPLIADGGIGARVIKTKIFETAHGKKRLRIIRLDPSTISKAGAWADAFMLGTFFNVCKEAAGDNFEHEGIEYKGRWGEGSLKAVTLARYSVDENIQRPSIKEGIDDHVTCEMTPKPGLVRLKHAIEEAALNMRMTMSNVGARDPVEYRDKCVLERASGSAKRAAGID